ncbi:MAG: hypothetical protein ABIK92_10230 [Pseudomonadota bacterium]
MKSANKFMSSVLVLLSICLYFIPDGQCGHDFNRFPLPQIKVNPTILLVGTFYPANKRPQGDVITIKILNKKTYFKIEIVRNINGTEHGYSIINNLFPPELKLIGPDKLIRPLLKKKILGKVYSLRGTIYSSDNTLHLDIVKQGNMFDEIWQKK